MDDYNTNLFKMQYSKQLNFELFLNCTRCCDCTQYDKAANLPRITVNGSGGARPAG